jgi:mRNA interferase RelE/StbE
MYKLRIEKAVIKSLEKINEPYYSKIKTAIMNPATNQRPVGYKKLKGRDGFRIRVAD